MPTTGHILLNDVNKNYLEKVMSLAEEAEVMAHEDIFDARGMKLIAKGARLSRTMQERLILHRLSKPLESSIAVEDGVNVHTILSGAKHLSEQNQPVACLMRASCEGRYTPLGILQDTRLGNAMSMMLTMTEQGGEAALMHSIMVSLVSECLAKKIGLGEKEQGIAALAGLLHDIGELYIAPEYLTSNRRLLPHEWRHVVVHPRIGEMLIRELEHYPPAVAQAVAEHHERFDGAGYPRQLAGQSISIVGQILAVAESVSGIFTRTDRPLERAELALKIIPGEHSSSLVSAVSQTLQSTERIKPSGPAIPRKESHNLITDVFFRLSSAVNQTQELLDSSSIRAKHVLLQLLSQLHNIRLAFSSTGLYVCIGKDADMLDEDDMEVMFEAAVAVKEISWRLCDAARYLALQCSAMSQEESDILQPLINLMDKGS